MNAGQKLRDEGERVGVAGPHDIEVTAITTGERNGKSLRLDAVLVFRFRDGKISGCSDFENDQYRLDEFFS